MRLRLNFVSYNTFYGQPPPPPTLNDLSLTCSRLISVTYETSQNNVRCWMALGSTFPWGSVRGDSLSVTDGGEGGARTEIRMSNFVFLLRNFGRHFTVNQVTKN